MKMASVSECIIEKNFLRIDKMQVWVLGACSIPFEALHSKTKNLCRCKRFIFEIYSPLVSAHCKQFMHILSANASLKYMQVFNSDQISILFLKTAIRQL